MNKSKLMIIGVALLMITACGGSSEDIDTVAAGMMTGSDPVSEKDAKCIAKSLKKIVSDDQWDALVKGGTGRNLSDEDAMALIGPSLAAAAECGINLLDR